MFCKHWNRILGLFLIKKGRDIFDVLQLLAVIAVPISIAYFAYLGFIQFSINTDKNTLDILQSIAVTTIPIIAYFSYFDFIQFSVNADRDIFDLLQLLSVITIPISLAIFSYINHKREKEEAIKREKLENWRTLHKIFIDSIKTNQNAIRFIVNYHFELESHFKDEEAKNRHEYVKFIQKNEAIHTEIILGIESHIIELEHLSKLYTEEETKILKLIEYLKNIPTTIDAPFNKESSWYEETRVQLQDNIKDIIKLFKQR